MKRCQQGKWASPLLGLQMRFHQLLTLVIKQKRVLNYSLLNWHCWRVVDTRKVWVIFHFGSLTSKARRRRRSLYRNHIQTNLRARRPTCLTVGEAKIIKRLGLWKNSFHLIFRQVLRGLTNNRLESYLFNIFLQHIRNLLLGENVTFLSPRILV